MLGNWAKNGAAPLKVYLSESREQTGRLVPVFLAEKRSER